MARAKKLRPPHEGKVSKAGLWSLSVGEKPYKVTVREDRKPGARILYDYTEHARRQQPPTGVESVRDEEGQFVRTAIERAKELAADRSARLRLDRLREEVEPQRMTVAQAFDLYFRPERGGVPPSKSGRKLADASRRDWLNHLGADTPWNAVVPADVDALAKAYRRRGNFRTAEQRVQWLRTVYNWLRKKARIRGLEDPTESFDFHALMEGYEPAQPRYTLEEAEAIVAAAWKVDPRFRLLIALMDDSVVRRKALILTMRSAIDRPLNMEPDRDQAPHGWIVYPALKGQPSVLWFLTEFQRRELGLALTTHLSELERLYQEQQKDYPLFPAARMYERARAERAPIDPLRGGAYRSIGEGRTEQWLQKAEKEAGVPHVHRRLWHGFRRTSSNVVYDAAGLSVLTTAGGWTNQATPGKIYVGKERNRDRSTARQAMETKRKGEPK